MSCIPVTTSTSGKYTNAVSTEVWMYCCILWSFNEQFYSAIRTYIYYELQLWCYLQDTSWCSEWHVDAASAVVFARRLWFIYTNASEYFRLQCPFSSFWWLLASHMLPSKAWTVWPHDQISYFLPSCKMHIILGARVVMSRFNPKIRQLCNTVIFACIMWIEIPFQQTWASTLEVSYLTLKTLN